MTDDLREALEAARRAYEKMSPEEKRQMFRQQQRSWVRGELMLKYPDMTREEADALIDRAISI